MSRRRQEAYQAQVRAQIIQQARDIVMTEGLSALSIRKITTAMDYSPGIIYHYFKDKNALIEALLTEGYMAIVNGIGQVSQKPNDPAANIRAMMKAYVAVAMEERVLYRLFLLSDSPEILKRTAVLNKGISSTSPAIGSLTAQIQSGVDLGIFEACDAECTAQAVWAACYGLVMKLMTEGDVDLIQQTALVDRQLDILLKGLEK